MSPSKNILKYPLSLIKIFFKNRQEFVCFEKMFLQNTLLILWKIFFCFEKMFLQNILLILWKIFLKNYRVLLGNFFKITKIFLKNRQVLGWKSFESSRCLPLVLKKYFLFPSMVTLVLWKMFLENILLNKVILNIHW